MRLARHRAPPAAGAARAGHVLGAALGEALDLALAQECAGCGAPGSRWCDACWPALTGQPTRRVLRPDPAADGAEDGAACWAGAGCEDRAGDVGDPASSGWEGAGAAREDRHRTGLVVWSAAAYDGPVRAALVAWKDHERPDVTPVLAAALRRAARSAVAELASLPGGGAPVLVVPAPSSAASRRVRGRRPVHELARQALGGAGGGVVAGQVLPVLVQRRGVRDQSGLGAADRAANLAGAVRVPTSWGPYVRGRPCLVVDDVVTTGATLAEAARALRGAGAGPVVAVTVAATVLRSGVRHEA